MFALQESVLGVALEEKRKDSRLRVIPIRINQHNVAYPKFSQSAPEDERLTTKTGAMQTITRYQPK